MVCENIVVVRHNVVFQTSGEVPPAELRQSSFGMVAAFKLLSVKTCDRRNLAGLFLLQFGENRILEIDRHRVIVSADFRLQDRV